MRRKRSRSWLPILLLCTVAGVAVLWHWGPSWWDRAQTEFSTSRCTATFADASYSLTAEQSANAALVAAVGMQEGFGVNGIRIGIATAIQESSLRNIDYGDRDSLGLFQQRPSQGWGSETEIMDRHYAARAFYRELLKIPGWQDMTLTEAAQAVQRSAFPDAYAQHTEIVEIWGGVLAGHGGTMACDLPGPAEYLTANEFQKRVDLDFGPELYQVAEVMELPTGSILAVTPATDSAEARRAFAAWAVATAIETNVVAVAHDGQNWFRSDEVEIPEIAVSGVLVKIAGASAG